MFTVWELLATFRGTDPTGPHSDPEPTRKSRSCFAHPAGGADPAPVTPEGRPGWLTAGVEPMALALAASVSRYLRLRAGAGGGSWRPVCSGPDDGRGRHVRANVYPVVSRLLQISLLGVFMLNPPASVCGVKVSRTCSRFSCRNRRNLRPDVWEPLTLT